MEGRTRQRGRPTKPAREGEKTTLSLRVTPALKQRLDEAGAASGRNLSQEAEWRLETSLGSADLLEQSLDLAFGPQAVGLALLLAQVASSIGGNSGARHWLSDPYAFDQVAQGITEVLEALRPPGEIVEPEPPSGRFAGLSLLFDAETRQRLGRGLAQGAMRNIAQTSRRSLAGEWGERVRRRLAGAPLSRLRAKFTGADADG
jgi:hypothetical protein